MKCIACNKDACVAVQQILPKASHYGSNKVFFFYCKEHFNKIYPEG
jgi:hypothetical protein